MSEITLTNVEIRVVVFTLWDNRLQVLLHPIDRENGWSLPGSPTSSELSLEGTAARCIESLTGQNEIYLEQLYTYGDPGRQPEGPLISVVYFALLAANPRSNEVIEKSQAAWYPVDNRPVLAWDHAEILAYAVRRLRYKLEYTAVGFELLPDTFTLSELQHTYELILGEKLDKRNFRRRILEAGIIEPTSNRRSGEGRPAQLYHYRPDAVAEVKARRLFP